MKAIIKEFFKSYFLAVGLTTAFALFFYYVIENLKAEKAIKILGIMMIALVPITLIGTIIFRNIQTKKELWIRRAAFIAICCIVYPLCFIAFNMIKRDTVTQYIVFLVINAVLISASCLSSYIIVDKIEQKKIDEINKKLGELK